MHARFESVISGGIFAAVVFLLDKRVPSSYIQLIPKEVLSAPGKVGRIHLVEKRMSGLTVEIFSHPNKRGLQAHKQGGKAWPIRVG